MTTATAPSRQVRRRQARKGPVTVGFTPVPRTGLRWQRIQRNHIAKLAAECKGKTQAELEVLGLPTNPDEFRAEVGRRMSRDLPAPRMVRNPHPRPSKSNDPAYIRKVSRM